LPVQNDRYDPLPGLLSVPAFLYRKLGPRGRMAVKIGGGLFLVALVVGAIVLVPQIVETKRERADRERREAAAALAERRRELIAEQRPHRGRAAAGASHAAVVVALEEGILADARARDAAGDLHGPPANRVVCEPLTGADLDAARIGYDCIAVTSDIPGAQGVVGHPFRGVADFSTGRVTWCKISGRPGEGSLSREGYAVRLPRACSV
jgi:hypothetical protein